MNYIDAIVVIKDGGYEKIKITPQMFGQLALAIQEKGSEVVQLTSKKFNAVGIVMFGKEAGERVIINY